MCPSTRWCLALRTSSAKSSMRSRLRIWRKACQWVDTMQGAFTGADPMGNDERGLEDLYRGWSKAVAVQYPFMAKLLEQIAQTYDREAVWHDTEANVRKRISY